MDQILISFGAISKVFEPSEMNQAACKHWTIILGIISRTEPSAFWCETWGWSLLVSQLVNKSLHASNIRVAASSHYILEKHVSKNDKVSLAESKRDVW